MSLDLKTLQQWVGNTEDHSDRVTLAPVQALAATLNRHETGFSDGSELPPLWHWLYFLAPARQADLAEDGHPKKGGFLPPVPLPRRMWAGSRFTFNHPVKLGQSLHRRSTISNVDVKQGRSGKLAFIGVQHEIENDAGTAIVEHHDIVYRDNPPKSQRDQPLPAGKPAPQQQSFEQQIVADPVLLFRYSALTFNGHRIHYDRDYVTRVEDYPGLVVHGPLLATLLVELLHNNLEGITLKKFEFTAMRPVFDINPFTVCGHPESGSKVHLWVQDHDGFLCMQATAEIEYTTLQD